MKSLLWLTSLASTLYVPTRVKVARQQLVARQATAPALFNIPEYNFTMPVDHFSTSNTQTYSNRFYVNDTYYQPGGPVILYDFGETGVTPVSAARELGEYNGTVSAPIRLAEQLNGLVVGWEHRYYGYSRPVPMNETSGEPVNGAKDYVYLTIEQALEDLVYFANGFNQTTLNQNTNVQSTANLDPYHSPWIFIGGSYPGARAAWARIRNPEIFYASWSSSAPVESRGDGSIYWNPIYRAMPSNCTKDIQAVAAYVDTVLTSDTANDVATIQAGVYLMQYPTETDISAASEYSDIDIASIMLRTFSLGYQDFGAAQTNQVFCDYMESFDVSSFSSAVTQTSSVYSTIQAALQNPGDVEPSDDGIVASSGQNGPAIGFVAFVYAYALFVTYFADFENSFPPGYYDSSINVASDSWEWQTLTQVGYTQGVNVSSPYHLGSKFANTSATRSYEEQGLFPNYAASTFPSQPNTTGPLTFGGWNMKPSNVMFTNGEFDPWRAFSVASQEQAVGAPQRNITQSVPKCNTPPSGTDVFGLVFGGAVHAEDISISSSFHKASEANPKPLYQALTLFTSAYKAWQPCFNQSRDDIRNGKGVDGHGGGGSGSSSSSGSSSGSGSSSSSKSNDASQHRSHLGAWAVMTSFVWLCSQVL